MAKSEFHVIFYETRTGIKPAKDFLNSLDPKMRVKMLYMIKLLEEKGNQLRMPYSEEIEDGIFELRAKAGSNISRVIYFFYIGQTCVLTNGFVKKTQKTPSSVKALAKKYRADFLKQMKDEGRNNG